MEKNKVRARLTPSRLQAPANDVALPGVPGDGGPEGCQGAPERTRPATGHRGGEQLESSAVATGVVPCSSFRDGRWRGAPRLARETRPPSSPRGTVTLTTHGRRGQDGAPEGRSQPQPLGSCGGKGEPGGERACRSAGRALAAGGPGRCCPRRQPGTPRRFAQRLFPGEPPATPGHEAEGPKTKDPTLRPLLAKSQRAESISPESFPPPPAELRAGPGAPSRAEPWQRGRSRLREGERAGEGGRAAVWGTVGNIPRER